MSDVKRIYVEKRTAYATEANEIKHNLIEQLGLEIDTLRIINRYDVQGVNDDILKQGINTILAEPMVDDVYQEEFPTNDQEAIFAIEFLPGQYDQRADACEQCFQLLNHHEKEVMMFKLNGFKFREISQFIHKPTNTCIWLYHQAIQKIRRNIDG